jgi:hypothetical protein
MHQYNVERYNAMKIKASYTKNLVMNLIGKAVAALPKDSLNLKALTNSIQTDNEYLDIREDFMKKIEFDKKYKKLVQNRITYRAR